MSISAAQHDPHTPSWTHVPADVYDSFIRTHITNPDSLRHMRSNRNDFVRCYPDLHAWMAEPLLTRVGRRCRRYGNQRQLTADVVSHRARPYLYFLALHGYIQLDWEWLLAIHAIRLGALGRVLGVEQSTSSLLTTAINLGYSSLVARTAINWVIPRIVLHMRSPDLRNIRTSHIESLITAIYQFRQRPTPHDVRNSAQPYMSRHLLPNTRRVQYLLYQQGLTTPPPRRFSPTQNQLVHNTDPPRIRRMIEQYLRELSITAAVTTVKGEQCTLNYLVQWLVRAYPNIESLTEITRDHLLEFRAYLEAYRNPVTGRPLGMGSVYRRTHHVRKFCETISTWDSPDVPPGPLLLPSDIPRLPARIPRYIPDHELEPFMAAVRELVCPFQRTALLIARWSGARADEIRRLEIDCLDEFPDGTLRLRIPEGKTRRERVVPLNSEAADAIRYLQTIRQGGRGAVDPRSGRMVNYLFMRKGHLISRSHLFDRALIIVCNRTGLLTPEGKPRVHAHRLRHTVGTSLGRRGARLRTIMKVLGHTSANMSIRYIDITDREVLEDYQAVLGPEAILAGPAMETLRGQPLTDTEVQWLQTNFLKTALELGHCLRLPQEGPCECELYLACSKFVTTREYAPRLRRRRQLELLLVEDAHARGWSRDAERHQCTVQRIESFLAQLGEPIDGPEAE